MDALLHRLQFQDTPVSRKVGLVDWEPKPGDVIIATPPKSGTTLVCMMAHCLRSKGDTSFDEINADAIPCLEMAHDSNVDIDQNQRYSPRLFKTHAWYRDCPKNDSVKLVCVIRNPERVAISFYHFLGGWFFDKADIGMDEFIQRFVVKERSEPRDYRENASIFHVIKSYYEHRHDRDRVLFLAYENIVRHKRVHLVKLAEFLGVPYDDDLLDLVENLSSMEWMAAHETKFDEHHMKLAVNELAGLPRDAGLGGGASGKVRSGSKEGESISEETRLMLQRAWDDVLLPATGCRSYEELLDQLYQELYSDWF